MMIYAILWTPNGFPVRVRADVITADDDQHPKDSLAVVSDIEVGPYHGLPAPSRFHQLRADWAIAAENALLAEAVSRLSRGFP